MILISVRPSARSSICSKATTRRWTSWPSPSRCARRPYPYLHAEDIGIGVARAIRAACRAVRAASIWICRQACWARHGRDGGEKSLVKVIDPAPAQFPAPDAVDRALACFEGGQAPLIILGKGAAYAQADDLVRFVETAAFPIIAMSMAKGLLAG